MTPSPKPGCCSPPRTALTELARTQASGEAVRGAGYSLAGHLRQMPFIEAEPLLWLLKTTLAVPVWLCMHQSYFELS